MQIRSTINKLLLIQTNLSLSLPQISQDTNWRNGAGQSWSPPWNSICMYWAVLTDNFSPLHQSLAISLIPVSSSPLVPAPWLIGSELQLRSPLSLLWPKMRWARTLNQHLPLFLSVTKSYSIILFIMSLNVTTEIGLSRHQPMQTIECKRLGLW